MRFPTAAFIYCLFAALLCICFFLITRDSLFIALTILNLVCVVVIVVRWRDGRKKNLG